MLAGARGDDVSFKPELYYSVVCDKCGVNAQKDSDYSAWSDYYGAWAEAEASDWTEEAGKHYCFNCTLDRQAEEDAGSSS